MSEDIQQRVDILARMSVLTDAGDLPGLVALQEQATALALQLDADHAEDMARLARQIGALAEAIVLRDAPDADAAFAEINAAIESLQRTTDTSLGSVAAPAGPDDELLAAWISGCDGALGELEGRLLALERSPHDSEVIAEVRRVLHTLKGECGVLSLRVPQRLCHEAEALIEARADAGAAIPIDPILSLLDWLKSYLIQLSSDRSAQPGDGAAVMEALIAARSSESIAAVPAAAEEPAETDVSAEGQRGDPEVRAGVPSQHGPAGEASRVALVAQSGTEENIPEFLCEAKDHLSSSEEALLALAQGRSDPELVNTVFRAFHTIKGVSGFMGLTPLVSLAHSAEQMLDAARAGTLALGSCELDLLLACCDMLTRLLAALEGADGPPRGDLEALIARINAAASNGCPAGAIASSAAASNGAASPTGPGPLERVAPSDATSGIESKPSPVAACEGAPRARKSDQTVKVSTHRMDSLVTMVGELVIAQQMVSQDVLSLGGEGQQVQRTLSHMSKMVRELQEVSMSLRMVNLKGTFQRMTRLARDVAHKSGKQIEVLTEGEHVELDRNVVEAITDPLVHMIRNACDHGVDSPEERRRAGKRAAGCVWLRAYHSGGSIVIEIADDGRGLDREKLLAKARAKGLLPAGVNEASMSDGEVFELIFLPGFSTAETITETSGRGVGMDVVRRNIEALRGKVEIRSTPGRGTTFVMRLPLTMAIIDGMVVRVGSQRYVLPTLSIQQSFRPRSDAVMSVVGAGEMVNVRGSVLPVFRLNRVLQLDEGAACISDGILIVVESHDTRFCLMVDEIVGQQTVVIKTLTQTGLHVKGVSGGAILGDGRVALILDAAEVLALAHDGSLDPRASRGLVGAADV